MLVHRSPLTTKKTIVSCSTTRKNPFSFYLKRGIFFRCLHILLYYKISFIFFHSSWKFILCLLPMQAWTEWNKLGIIVFAFSDYGARLYYSLHLCVSNESQRMQLTLIWIRIFAVLLIYSEITLFFGEHLSRWCDLFGFADADFVIIAVFDEWTRCEVYDVC